MLSLDGARGCWIRSVLSRFAPVTCVVVCVTHWKQMWVRRRALVAAEKDRQVTLL